MPAENILHFPEDFCWGTATAAYQIEGAVNEGGRGPSIWDTFCRQPGNVERGEHGDVATDHYHRWPADLDILSDLGVKAYRFSIAWPRILPEGAGAVNPAGLDFYDRLVDGLLARGIEPYVTLYHWDLPQTLQDLGGWTRRQTAYDFAEYAYIVAGRLGDRVPAWITHNEPWVAAFVGHYMGRHAPGLQDIRAALQATHHLLLSHGLAVDALRAALPSAARVGITLNMHPAYPASDSDADRQAVRRADGVLVRLFMDPLFRGRYPQDMLDWFGPVFPEVPADDLARIAAPLDFLGINYYTRDLVRDEPTDGLVQAGRVYPVGNEYSQMWEIYPQGIYDLLTRIWNDYRPAQLYITENGICVPDGVDFDGRVRDERRIRYLHAHLAELHRALAGGVPLRGYFVWSLLDNFEWGFGYRMRFGLVYVDFDTLARTVKDSGRWYSQVISENGLHEA